MGKGTDWTQALLCQLDDRCYTRKQGKISITNLKITWLRQWAGNSYALSVAMALTAGHGVRVWNRDMLAVAADRTVLEMMELRERVYMCTYVYPYVYTVENFSCTGVLVYGQC